MENLESRLNTKNHRNNIFNKLQNEKSPYLLQHAQNPVNWYPWGDEAFEKARTEDKPIFLSIGYSTCHWCHVMAHESFEDNSVAEILNENYISIKVDKEERPDVDSVYMDVCQAFTGSGGWPTSIFMDHDKRPFYAGTYYPKEAFMSVLNRIGELWDKDRSLLDKQAHQLIEAVSVERKRIVCADIESIDTHAADILKKLYEPDYGGFSKAPKFPTSHNLLFLMDQYENTKDTVVLKMCEKTLNAMRGGGIYDHVGGGFSRYSTDHKWLVPHFEKMLYDNALLMIAYSRLYELTLNEKYAQTVKEIAKYLTRDLMHKDGVFYTAEDADSEGVEGEFYLFTKDEVKNILGADAEIFCKHYNVIPSGNFEGKNILNTIKVDIPDSMTDILRSCLEKLFAYRSKRIRPHRDEKILTGQNGLAIAAFSIAGRILKNIEYIQTAEKAVDFIFNNLKSNDGRFISLYKDGKCKTAAFAEDYAYLTWGLLELYESTEKCEYLSKAETLQEILSQDFYDNENGGYFQTSKNAEKMIINKKELYDGATPSYNSVIMHNLLNIFLYTHNTDYIKQLSLTLKYFSQELASYPHAYIHSIALVSKLKNSLPKIIICDDNACRPAPKSLNEFMRLF